MRWTTSASAYRGEQALDAGNYRSTAACSGAVQPLLVERRINSAGGRGMRFEKLMLKVRGPNSALLVELSSLSIDQRFFPAVLPRFPHDAHFTVYRRHAVLSPIQRNE